MIVAATSYPLLNAFWTILEFFLLVLWVWLVVTVVIDILWSSDLSGGGKAVWVLFVVILPLLGVLIYLIVRGAKMHERAGRRAHNQDEAFRQSVQQATATAPASTADQLTKLADLRDQGVISNEEFERQKAKILA